MWSQFQLMIPIFIRGQLTHTKKLRFRFPKSCGVLSKNIIPWSTLKRWSPGSPGSPPGRHGHCRDLAGGLALDGVWVAQDHSDPDPRGALFGEKVEEWNTCHPPTSVDLTFSWISKASKGSWVAERVWGLVKSKPKIPCFRWGCLTNSANHLKIAEMYLHFPSFSYIPFFRAAINWGDAPFRDKPAVFTAESARKVGFDVATLHCEEPQEPRRVAVSNFGYGSNLPKNSVMNIAQYQCDLMWYVFLLPLYTRQSSPAWYKGILRVWVALKALSSLSTKYNQRFLGACASQTAQNHR